MIQSDQLQLLLGKIVLVRGLQPLPDGRQAYLTSTVSYDIQANVPGSMVTHYMSQQVPEVRLWPADQELDADRLLNTTCVGIKSGLDVMWHFYEPPVVAGCPVLPPPSPLLAPLLNTPGPVRVQVPGGNIDSGSPAPTPTAAPAEN
jgi:hypothetical protein